jgi:Fe-S-cluster formation regulator IscX/YfhJ
MNCASSEPCTLYQPPSWLSISPTAVVIRIEGIGPVPSFKNRKRISGDRLVTAKRVKEWMQNAERIIALQLLSAFPTTDPATVTAASLRSWIVSSTPEDDSRAFLTACCSLFTERLVSREEAGACLFIDRI